MTVDPEPLAFTFAPDDPLAEEHAAVLAWVEEVLGTLPENRLYEDVELKILTSGRRLLDASADQARRYVLAATAQAKYWDQQLDAIRNQGSNELERINAHWHPGHALIWGHRRQTTAVIFALMRRALPFESADLVVLLDWCEGVQPLITHYAPIGAITRSLERFAARSPVDPELLRAMRAFAARLQETHEKEVKRCVTAVQQLCAGAEGQPGDEPADAVVTQPPPGPAPAGSAGILQVLKRRLGMLPSSQDAGPSQLLEPDGFPLAADSPLRDEHERLSALFEELVGTSAYHSPELARYPAGRALLAMDPLLLGRVALAAAERHVHALLASADYNQPRVCQSRYSAAGIMTPLLKAPLDLDRDGLFDLLLYLSTRPTHERAVIGFLTKRLIEQAAGEAARSPLSEGERFVLSLLRTAMIPGPTMGTRTPEVEQLVRLVGDNFRAFLTPGEAWSEAANADLARLEPARRETWTALLEHALSASSARPSARWMAEARKRVQAVGADQVQATLLRWLPLVAHGRTVEQLPSYPGDTRGAGDVMNDENATCLRGLLWMTQVLPGRDELARAITAVALSAYKKVPGIGPRAVKVGNAAVYALSEMGTKLAVGQLAMLKVRVKFGTAQKEIEKAFTASAEALGLPRDQIEEMGVPSYGLEEVGLRRESFGEHRAELVVTGSDAEIRWFDAKEKSLKSVPARVKADHKEELKDLQQALKDIQAMLPAQRDRIDAMFLLQKTWPIAEWRERYLDHPLVGTIARRLIWNVDGTPALFVDGRATDVTGAPIEHGQTAEITPWHPVGRPVGEVVAWRGRLEELGITQPFKQAHREVYLLTDAELNTRTYSNRFAAHILRQHQFNALCAARGWKNKLRLMVDDDYPPATRELPGWGLRAEFWVDGIGDDYGVDTNDAGVFLRLATDQVRFYRTEAARNLAHAGGGHYESLAHGPGEDSVNEPIPLEEIPALVFSEVMRDVDLFVGVASVGNDPTWQDGGPEGRYRQYWHDYSFGELSDTATTRKQVLERLVPRLKIADRCRLSDRFLIVRGQLRTYKIHLGSGNILMEPNDQYLCIVPDARARAGGPGELFLPFEGDNTLSVIISKAFLLAADDKIKDPSITSQIQRR